MLSSRLLGDVNLLAQDRTRDLSVLTLTVCISASMFLLLYLNDAAYEALPPSIWWHAVLE